MEQVLEIPTVIRRATSQLPRVLYVVVTDPSNKFGSLEEQIAVLWREFQEHDSLFLPLFLCRTLPQRPTPLDQLGVNVTCVVGSEFRVQAARQIGGIIRRYQIDVVHWNFSPPALNPYLWWLSVFSPGIRHYFTDHISRPLPLPRVAKGLAKWSKRLLLSRYAKVVCVSDFVFACEEREGVWANQVTCKHFINTDRFRPNVATRAEVRAEGHAADRFVVLIVAHLIRDKGLEVALQALVMLPSNVVLWVVGTGDEGARLRALCTSLGIAERVTFYGHQTNVERYMQGADCVACPSIWAEAAGLVNLEAQASGLPVIASCVGGIPEYVLDGKTGLLFSQGDASALAAHIRQLLHSPDLRKRLSDAGRQFVEDRFSAKARLPEYLDLYRQIH